MNMPEIRPEETPALFMAMAMMPPDAITSMINGLMYAIEAAVDGECKECSCDTCITVRGAGAGLKDMMGVIE